MSYDIQFFPRVPGLTVEVAYKTWVEERKRGTSTERLSAARRRSLADALLSSGLGLEEFDKDFDAIATMMGISREQATRQYGGIELNVPEGSAAVYQIEVDPEGVSLTVPYWEMPPEGVEALKVALGKLFEVMGDFHLVGYDP